MGEFSIAAVAPTRAAVVQALVELELTTCADGDSASFRPDVETLRGHLLSDAPLPAEAVDGDDAVTEALINLFALTDCVCAAPDASHSCRHRNRDAVYVLRAAVNYGIAEELRSMGFLRSSLLASQALDQA